MGSWEGDSQAMTFEEREREKFNGHFSGSMWHKPYIRESHFDTWMQRAGEEQELRKRLKELAESWNHTVGGRRHNRKEGEPAWFSFDAACLRCQLERLLGEEP